MEDKDIKGLSDGPKQSAPAAKPTPPMPDILGLILGGLPKPTASEIAKVLAHSEPNVMGSPVSLEGNAISQGSVTEMLTAVDVAAPSPDQTIEVKRDEAGKVQSIREIVPPVSDPVPAPAKKQQKTPRDKQFRGGKTKQK